MTIGRKPKDTRLEFIQRGETQKSGEPYAITLRLTRDFLNRIDAKAKSLNITRSAWIKSTLTKGLEDD
jgi:hypothetical protein